MLPNFLHQVSFYKVQGYLGNPDGAYPDSLSNLTNFGKIQNIKIALMNVQKLSLVVPKKSYSIFKIKKLVLGHCSSSGFA